MRTLALKERPQLRVVAKDEASPPLDDVELIDAFERGDLRTSERLYDRLAHVVHATLVKVLGRRCQEHDDLVQCSFEQILITLSRKKFARACSLSSWAVAVTTHVALNAIRAQQRERRNFERGVEAPDVSRPSQPAPDQSSMMRALRTELGRLPETTANVVVLHEVMGHDLAEIAVLTGLSVAAAQSRLVRGRAELRRRLESRAPHGNT
jgi:RNA polymerase sigma-70 factor (ECF subfamily)